MACPELQCHEDRTTGALTITFPSGINCFVTPMFANAHDKEPIKWQGYVRFGSNKLNTVLFDSRDDAQRAIVNHVRAHLQRDLTSADVFLGGHQLPWEQGEQTVGDDAAFYVDYTFDLMSGVQLRVVESGSGWCGEAYANETDEDPFILTSPQPTHQAAQRAIVKRYTERLHGDLNQLRGKHE